MDKSKAEIASEEQYPMTHCYTQEQVDWNRAAQSGFVNGYHSRQVPVWKSIDAEKLIGQKIIIRNKENDYCNMGAFSSHSNFVGFVSYTMSNWEDYVYISIADILSLDIK